MDEVKWTFSHHEKKGCFEYDVYTGWLNNIIVIKKVATFKEIFGLGANPVMWFNEKAFKTIVL